MKKKKGLFFNILGLLLIAAALGLTVYNLLDDQRADKSVERITQELTVRMPLAVATAPSEPGTSGPGGTESPMPVIPALPLYKLYPEVEMPTIEVDGNRYIGILEIKALELELPVQADWSYPGLKISPCRYVGSAYTGDMVICAHNYGSHFGRLKELPPSTELTFTDCDGNLFRYQVVEMEILQPTAVENMVLGDWDLTLFTCTLGGQTRVTLRCELIAEEPYVD